MLKQSVTDICNILEYFAEYSGNSLPKFWDNISVPSSRTSVVKPLLFHSFEPNCVAGHLILGGSCSTFFSLPRRNFHLNAEF